MKQTNMFGDPEPALTPAPATFFDPRLYLASKCVDANVIEDWLAHRKTKKSTVTKTVIDMHEREGVKAGKTLQEVFETCCSMGWQGYKAEWDRPRQGFVGAGKARFKNHTETEIKTILEKFPDNHGKSSNGWDF